MTAKRHQSGPAARSDAGDSARAPQGGRRLRLPLRTVEEVQTEMARLYRQAKVGEIAIADASRLGNLLAVLGRSLEATKQREDSAWRRFMQKPISEPEEVPEGLHGVDLEDPIEMAKILADIGRRAARRAEELQKQGIDPFEGWEPC